MDLTARGRVPEVGITAHDATISFRITGVGATEEEARALIEPTAELIYERFGSLVAGRGLRRRRRGPGRPAGPHGLHAGHGRVVHRRPDRAPGHGDPGGQPVLPGRGRDLFQRVEGRAAGRPGRPDRGARGGQPGGGRGDGRGRAQPAGRHDRHQHHRRRRPRRRHAREARGAGLPGIVDGRAAPRPDASTWAPNAPASSSRSSPPRPRSTGRDWS